MRVLCITQNLPGELDPMAAHLAPNPENQVFMAALRQRHNTSQPGIRRIILKKCNASRFEKNYTGYWNLAISTAANAEKSFSQTLKQDFYPDIILACASNGIAFALPQIFPRSYLVSYADTRLLDYPVTGPGFYESRRVLQACQFMQSQLGFWRLPCQKEQLEGVKPENIGQLPLFVDTEFFEPVAPATEPKKLVTVISGVLSERQLSIFWGQVRDLLQAMPDVSLALLAEGGLQGWRWEEMAANLPESSRPRLQLHYSPLNDSYRDLLRESAYVLCPMGDMSVAQRLLEAMASEVPILAGISSLDFLKPGHNALAFQMFRDQTLAGLSRVMIAEAGRDAFRKISKTARADILRNFDQHKILPSHMDFIIQSWQRHRGTVS